MFWYILIGLLVILFIVYIVAPPSTSNRRTTSSSPSSQIHWKNLKTNHLRNSTEPKQVVWNDDVPDDIKNILKNVIGSKDPLTQEEFLPGEQIYFCRQCRLAYHQDSWQELDQKCRDCKSNKKTKFYTLPNLKN